MTTTAIVFFVVFLLLGLLACRMPVWLALASSGIVGLLLLQGPDFVSNSLASISFDQTSTFTLTIIPMFILMGMFAVKARMADQVFLIAQRVFQKLPGGLGISAVTACAGFAAVSGSSIGTAATVSKMAIGQMRKAGYPASLAGGLVAMAGTLGAMIPPSVFLVLYAVLTGESIAEMLAAGIIPGIISAVAYSIYVLFRTRKMVLTSPTVSDLEDGRSQSYSQQPDRSLPPGQVTTVTEPAASTESTQSALLKWKELPYRGLFRIAVLFLIIMVGIYSGYFTPTESAAIGAIFAAFMLVLEFRKHGIREITHRFIAALQETAQTTSMVFAIVVGSAILSLFFVVARVPQKATTSLTSLDIPDWAILALLLVLLLPLGMALESISILVITVPLIYPIATDLGFDGVWLGILIVKLIEIGMVTPPVGVNCFVVAGTSGLKSTEVFKGVWPFVLIEMAIIVFLFLLPSVVLWLPSMAVN